MNLKQINKFLKNQKKKKEMCKFKYKNWNKNNN